MPRDDVEPDSSSDSGDAELMKARTGDYSEEEDNNTLVRRRKRKVRGRGSVRARRERSLTPDARGTQLREIVATKKAAPDPKQEEEEEQEVIKILPSEALGEDEGWGDKENITQNSQPEKQITKSQSESIVDENNEDNVEKVSELEEDAGIEEDVEEEVELLNPRDPRYVPKSIAFYMHDTKRMAIPDDNAAFKSDQQDDDGTYVLGDAFEPTKDGKWGHDMFDKICDKSQPHTREDHWGKSYGFRQNFLNFMPAGGPRGGRNSNRVCLDWQQGHCNYGHTCRFLHNDDSRQQNQDGDQWNGPDRNPGVCYDWQKGLCNRGNRCRFSHYGGGGGAGVCYDWQDGECHRGDRCKFTHEENNGRRNSSGNGRRRNDICYDYQRGQCFREYCRFSHEDSGYGGGYSRSQQKEKAGLCLDWQNGTCKRGNSCRLAHEDYNDKEGSKDYLEEKTTTSGRPAGGPVTDTRRDENEAFDGWEDNDSSLNKTEDEEVTHSKKGVDNSASQKNKTQPSEDKQNKTLEISKSKESNTELSGFGNDTRNWDEYSSCDDGNFN